MIRRMQRGFSIVSAIFILVVLAGLGAALVTVSTTQSMSSALDVQGARAYQAARAGVEWGMYRVWDTNHSCRMGTEPYCTSATAASCPFATESFSPPAPTLAEFVVTVHCSRVSDPKGGPAMFRIEAWACNVPAPDWTPFTDACPGVAGNAAYAERHVAAAL